MPPVPTTRPKERQQTPSRVGFDDVYDEYGNTLSEVLSRQRHRERRQQQATQGEIDSLSETVEQSQMTRKMVSEEGSDQTVAVFTGIRAGRTYRIEFTDLSWFTTGSVIVIGYNEGDDFNVLLTVTTLPEEASFEVEIPEESEPDSLEIRITGDCDTRVSVTDISDTMNLMEDISQPDAELTAEQVANILHNLGLDTILEDYEERIAELEQKAADLEDRVAALEGE